MKDMASSQERFLQDFLLYDNATSLEELAYKDPPIGLKLRRTPSLLDYEGKILSRIYVPQTEKAHDQKAKADHFPFSLLRIGDFTFAAKHAADLVAKCYYAKRKLVWEILENGLKSKIEIAWQDILAMRVIIQKNRPGILELELNQPPMFFHEGEPTPRKHTIWRASFDFTGGQASIYRRHYLEIQPGILERQYEKFKYCRELWELSQRLFPSSDSPCFSLNEVTTLPYRDDQERGSQSQPIPPTTQQPWPRDPDQSQYMFPTQHLQQHLLHDPQSQSMLSTEQLQQPCQARDLRNMFPCQQLQQPLLHDPQARPAFSAEQLEQHLSLNPQLVFSSGELQQPYPQSMFSTEQLQQPWSPIAQSMFSTEQLQQPATRLPPSLGIDDSLDYSARECMVRAYDDAELLLPPASNYNNLDYIGQTWLTDLESETVGEEGYMPKVNSFSSFAGIFGEIDAAITNNTNPAIQMEWDAATLNAAQQQYPPQVFDETLETHTLHPRPQWSTGNMGGVL